jgi:prepilin-type N-terminal cleavage/methylation domain-containing protein
MGNFRRHFATRSQADEGFTLIELATVIMIIGILIGLAIPSFLLVKRNAQNRLAQSTLRKFLISAEAEAASEAGSYSTATATGLAPSEPGSQTVGPTVLSTGPLIASVDGQATYWAAAVYSKSGDCFLVRESHASGVTFARTTNLGINCNAVTAATSATGPSW